MLLGRRKGNQKPSSSAKRAVVWLQIGLGITLLVVITLLFPQSRSFELVNLREGDVYIGEEIIAPFTFAINKSPQEYEADKEQARRRVAPVYERRSEISSAKLQALDSFADELYVLWSSRIARDEKLDSLKAFFKKHTVSISDEDLTFFLDRNTPPKADLQESRRTASAEAGAKPLLPSLKATARELYAIGILDTDKKSMPAWVEKISVVDKGVETLESLEYYYGKGGVLADALGKLRETFADDALMIKVGYLILSAFLEPNVLYDKTETDNRIQAAVRIVPLAKDQVLQGERIIDSHTKVTARHLEILSSLAEAKAERESRGGLGVVVQVVGRLVLVALSLGLLVVFLNRDRKSILVDPRRLLVMALVMLLVLFIAFAVNRLSLSAYLIPVAMASMLLTILFDTRVGFMATVALAVILGGMRGNDFGVVATSVFVGTVAIISVSRVRKRNWVVRSLLMLVGAYLAAITAVEFLRYTSFARMLEHWGYGLANGVLTPIFAYGLLVVLELAFDITTDMTYLELSDLNHPLLGEMAMVAPGTYHHSIMVGNLAEAAAETIGANGLLARVGAYYHDIGKMEKPEYFVENQRAGWNPQEKLSPTMSALLLVNHVRRGVEMAHQHGLPKEIRDCIEQHHGTSVMSYFFQKAREQNGDKDISDTDFRYPGPKPQTRETGILMLADAVEAASRTLKDPSVSRIRSLVSQLIDERFQAGELDESPLTLRDLNKIGEAFSKIIIGRFHTRLDYPESEEHKKSETRGTSEGEEVSAASLEDTGVQPPSD